MPPSTYREMKNKEDWKENLSEVDLEELRQQHRPSLRGHGWRQRGTQLVCTTCTYSHSMHLPTNLKYNGNDEHGNPKFIEIEF